MSDLWIATPTDPLDISKNFTSQEFAAALKYLKSGKASGPDSICPELMIHAGAALTSCLYGFLSSCLRHLKIPKVWRRALIVAIPKPRKPAVDPKSYRPISLLCVPYNSVFLLFPAAAHFRKPQIFAAHLNHKFCDSPFSGIKSGFWQKIDDSYLIKPPLPLATMLSGI